MQATKQTTKQTAKQTKQTTGLAATAAQVQQATSATTAAPVKTAAAAALVRQQAPQGATAYAGLALGTLPNHVAAKGLKSGLAAYPAQWVVAGQQYQCPATFAMGKLANSPARGHMDQALQAAVQALFKQHGATVTAGQLAAVLPLPSLKPWLVRGWLVAGK